MTNKHFIALADTIRLMSHDTFLRLTDKQIDYLSEFCESQNPHFDRQQWLNYIAGKCGPNGGKR
jgi:hypothetical protein